MPNLHQMLAITNADHGVQSPSHHLGHVCLLVINCTAWWLCVVRAAIQWLLWVLRAGFQAAHQSVKHGQPEHDWLRRQDQDATVWESPHAATCTWRADARWEICHDDAACLITTSWRVTYVHVHTVLTAVIKINPYHVSALTLLVG